MSDAVFNKIKFSQSMQIIEPGTEIGITQYLIGIITFAVKGFNVSVVKSEPESISVIGGITEKQSAGIQAMNICL